MGAAIAEAAMNKLRVIETRDRGKIFKRGAFMLNLLCEIVWIEET